MKSFIQTALLIATFTAPSFALAQDEDIARLVRIVSRNYYETDYTACVRTGKVIERDEKAWPGYIIFTASAEVLETYKGEKMKTLTYKWVHEAPSDGPVPGREVVISLNHHKKSGSLHVPDNGYVFEAKEPMLEALRNLSGDSMKAKISCVIPAPAKAINGAILRATLFEYDPKLADTRAEEVDTVSVEELDLAPGEESAVDFALSSVRRKDRSYYVTIFLHPNSDSNQRLYFIDGFQKLFEKKNTEILDIKLSPVDR